MYNRIVKTGTFKIDSAITIFKEIFSELLLSDNNEKILNDKVYVIIHLRYNYSTHAYYLITTVREHDNEILISAKDSKDSDDSYFVGEWLITKDTMRQFSKQNQIAQQVALAVQNVQISQNDTQITALTNAQKNAIYEELINGMFDEIFHPDGKEPKEENKNAALIELNHSPRVKQILWGKNNIDMNETKENLSKIDFEPELLSYIFQILDDNVTAFQNIANKSDSNLSP